MKQNFQRPTVQDLAKVGLTKFGLEKSLDERQRVLLGKKRSI